MKTKAFYIAFAGETAFLFSLASRIENGLLCVGSVNIDANAIKNAPKAISSLLEEHGYSGQPVVVGLDCFQVLMIDAEELDSKGVQDANLAFELESSCPIDAENMAAKLHAGKAFVGIKDRVTPFIQQLSELGVEVEAVLPGACLLASGIKKTQGDDPRSAKIRLEGHAETMHCQNGAVLEWVFGSSKWDVREDESVCNVVLQAEAGEANNEIYFEDVLPAAINDLLTDSPNYPVFQSILPKAKKSKLENALQRVGLATAACLGVLCLASVWQYFETTKAVRIIDSEISKIYQEAIPGAAPTRLVKRTLQSELTKLEKKVAVTQLTNSSHHVLQALRGVLEATPENFQLSIDRMDIDAERLIVFGSAGKGDQRDLDELEKFRDRITEAGFKPVTAGQEFGSEFKLSFVFDGAL